MELSYSSHFDHILGTPEDDCAKTGSKDNINKTLMQRLFPTGFKYESIKLLKYSWPIVISMFLGISIRVVATTFTGHLGKFELDATSMAISLANLVGTSIGIGLIAACDTLFSQSYGTKNKTQVGIYFQTALYVSTLSTVVSWAVLMNCNSILLLLGQNPYIAQYTEDFMFVFLPGLFLLIRYLQVQGKTVPPVVVSVIVNVLCIGLQYLLVYYAELGLRGSGIALLLCYTTLSVLLLLYILFTGFHKKTWGGWSRESLQGWGMFMKLGLSSVMMICLEWWTFEISMFLMGILGPIDLGANSIMYNIWMIYTSISLGVGSASAFQIGRYLGARNVEGAITATRVYFLAAIIVAIITAAITLGLGHYLPLMFSSDPGILELARQMIPILALFTVFGSLKNIAAGIVRGTGKQVLGGIIAFVSYFVFTMPIGVPLMFLTEVRGAGFWWGLNVGMAIGCVALAVLVFTTNWVLEADEAQIRAKLSKCLDTAHPTKTLENHAEYGAITGSKFNKGVGEGTKSSPSANKPAAPSKSQKTIESQTRGSPTEHVSQNETIYTETYWRNLTIRRILITIVCFGIFGFGVVCRFLLFVPPPLPALANVTQTIPHYANSTTMQH